MKDAANYLAGNEFQNFKHFKDPNYSQLVMGHLLTSPQAFDKQIQGIKSLYPDVKDDDTFAASYRQLLPHIGSHTTQELITFYVDNKMKDMNVTEKQVIINVWKEKQQSTN